MSHMKREIKAAQKRMTGTTQTGAVEALLDDTIQHCATQVAECGLEVRLGQKLMLGVGNRLQFGCHQRKIDI